MTMSRAHFQLVADVLRRASLDPSLDRATVETLAYSFASELAKTSPRFDRGRFLARALAPVPERLPDPMDVEDDPLDAAA